jgi:hypothetical protein
MIRFVRIALGIVAASVVVGLVRQALDLQHVAGIFGDAVFIGIGLLLASLSDREFFYGMPSKPYR